MYTYIDTYITHIKDNDRLPCSSADKQARPMIQRFYRCAGSVQMVCSCADKIKKKPHGLATSLAEDYEAER